METLRQQVGQWLKGYESEDELVAALMHLVNRDSDRVQKVQHGLRLELDAEDGAMVAAQLRWADAQMYFIATLKADADELLDKAEKFYHIPAGRSVPCTTDDGTPVPATGSKSKDPTHPDFVPKYVEMTIADRTIELKARVSAYRRLRDEYANMLDALSGRIYRAKDILEEMKARYRAAGIVERPM